MRRARDVYKAWLASVTNDDALKEELLAMNEQQINDAFFKDLSFGTGGLRGIMAAGTNRMNQYTVGRATRGLGRYLLAAHSTCPRVAIGYDTRNNSASFARHTAAILADMGIFVWIWKEPLPTPMLSYAVRELGCSAGIMLTASHNPAEYNGYKVYGADGCQITEEAADAISACIAQEKDFEGRITPCFEAALADEKIAYIDEGVYESYVSCVMANSVSGNPPMANKRLKIVYTPLNGTGRRPVLDVLARCSFSDVTVVKEQEEPDGNFPTCPYPNPEIPQAMQWGLAYAKRQSADLLIATDPDCDRVGVGVRQADGKYNLLTGNEIGLLLLDFICKRRTENGTMPKHPLAVKTVVTTDLACRIAERHGVSIVNVLTGFKYIGEHIGLLEKEGRTNDFILGFEESCGYLCAGYVRDKDGVLAAMLICEMAAFHQQKGKTLDDAVNDIYRVYGYCQSALFSYSFDGAQGAETMRCVMKKLRAGKEMFCGMTVEKLLDFQQGVDGLPKADMLKFLLADGSSITVRPSGTEPKLKVYLSVNATNKATAAAVTNRLRLELESIIQV